MALEKLDVYWPILILMAFGVLLVVGALVVSKIISPQKPTELKRQAYECGEDPVGNAWALFNMRFYVIGLIFIIFDVEVVFLFPWAAVYQQFIEQGDGLLVLIEVLLFILILLVGFAYVWVKSDLDWVKMKLKYAHGRYGHLKKIKRTNNGL